MCVERAGCSSPAQPECCPAFAKKSQRRKRMVMRSWSDGAARSASSWLGFAYDRHMTNIRLAILGLVAASLFIAADVEAKKKHETLLDSAISAYEAHHSYQVPGSGTVEVAFSPNEGSEALVVKVIDSSKRDLRMLAYSFTSAPVVSALLRAKKRGVDAHLIADYKSNVAEDRSGKSRAALSALANAGVEVRVIDVYPIHHDKVIVTDRETVELGSFNYSDAAAHRNSENVLVNWNNPKLAEVYLGHFERNHRQSKPFETQY
jgi:phosphatidylserine/phosphatidylglycerophosphate/cardiolipin synthase-like enzyme